MSIQPIATLRLIFSLCYTSNGNPQCFPLIEIISQSLKIEPSLPSYVTRKILRSMTFVMVGPVIRRSPVASKK